MPELGDLAAAFHGFAAFASSKLYSRLAEETAENPEVTSLLLDADPEHRWPMLLLAAVHLETMRSGEAYPESGAELAAFCREHDAALRATIATHSTQTNEVGRCAYLLPCFAHAADGRPLALIEVGASAGLVLNWDRYRYDYDPRESDPPLATPPVAWRVGIDLAPRPEDGWLRACVFADQPERVERLDAALAVARDHPPRLLGGDALDLLPELLAEVPAGAQPVVFHTAVLPYMEPEDADRLRSLASEATYVSAEADGRGMDFGLTVDGQPVGRAESHGRWLNWTAAG
jgi:hypothetical protein